MTEKILEELYNIKQSMRANSATDRLSDALGLAVSILHLLASMRTEDEDPTVKMLSDLCKEALVEISKDLKLVP